MYAYGIGKFLEAVENNDVKRERLALGYLILADRMSQTCNVLNRKCFSAPVDNFSAVDFAQCARCL
jgi:hypothetical protein